MKAFEKGKLDALNGTIKRGRAYETNKANDDYFAGVVAGLAQKHPGQMIVRCERDGTIFPAYPQPYTIPREGTTEYIECPTCARRYFKNMTGDYESDRILKILKRP